MESEKKLQAKKLETNALSSAIEIQNEHNLLLSECLTTLKNSMLHLHGATAPDEISDCCEEPSKPLRPLSLVERLNMSNNVRGYLLSQLFANLRLMEMESVINIPD
jgi:hypothetical protein